MHQRSSITKKYFFAWVLLLSIISGCASPNTGSPTYHQGQTSSNPVSFVSNFVLMAKVKSKFMSDDMVDDQGIDISVRQGVVYLDGWTSDEYQRRMAQDLARSVDGVARVVSRLQIANPGTVFGNPDTQVKKQITLALLNDPALSNQPISVLVTSDQVVLSGLVADSKQSLKAQAIAAGYAGQRELVNHIQAPP